MSQASERWGGSSLGQMLVNDGGPDRGAAPHCKETYLPSAEEVAAFVPGSAPAVLHRGSGCRECRNIGYSGRVAVYEVFGIDAEVRRMVIDGIDADAIRRAGPHPA